MKKEEEILGRILRELHKDGKIENNEYQGEDFYELLDRIK